VPPTQQLDEFRRERTKLDQIVSSVRSVADEKSDDWLRVAWRRVFDRGIALGLDERAALGRVSRGTELLLEGVEEELFLLGEIPAFPEWWPDPDDFGYDDPDPDDPHAPPAPAPLAVVNPSRASHVNQHPYAKTPQYGDVRDLRDRPRISPNDPFGVAGVGEWMHGEGRGAEVSIWETGVTGAPAGRPRLGTTDPAAAARLLLERCPGRTLDEVRGCLCRGKPSVQARTVRAELAVAVRDISVSRRATHKALAEALGCGIRAVDRLASPN
jgi:hypothetical protein